MQKNREQEKPPMHMPAVIMFLVSTFGALVVAPIYGFMVGYDSSAWIAAIALFFITGISITGGYHRLWSHNAYKAHPILRVWYAFWGATSLQNTILDWCSGHRVHHRYVDDVDLDPYSAKRGFWFSHMGWMIRDYPSGRVDFSNVKNLMKDPIVMFQYKYYLPLALLGNIGVPVALGLIFDDLWGMILLAGFVRLFVSHHVTFFINSLAHMWGSQPYTDENTAKDNAFLAFFTHGEGYHNYHHIFQNDYRNGIRWYQWDPTKWFIKACSWVGLASDLRKVPSYKIRRAVVAMQYKRAQAKLAEAENAEKWTDLLEVEYERFQQVVHEWAETQAEKLEETRKSLSQKFSQQKRVEFEKQIKLHSERLREIMAEYRASAAY